MEGYTVISEHFPVLTKAVHCIVKLHESPIIPMISETMNVAALGLKFGTELPLKFQVRLGSECRPGFRSACDVKSFTYPFPN